MKKFDFWNDQFNHFFSSATPMKNGKIDFSILKNKIIIIQGEKNSGKSFVAETLLDYYRKDKQVEDIVVIIGDNKQYLMLPNNGESGETFLSNRITTGINTIDITMSIWDKILQHKNKKKKYILLVDNFEKFNELNSYKFFEIIDKNTNILPVITTSDKKINKRLCTREAITIEIPPITLSDFLNYNSNINSLNKRSELFEQLRLKNEKEAKFFITITKGIYGTLQQLLILTKNEDILVNDKDTVNSVLNQIFNFDKNSYTDINRLILYFYMFNQYINFDVLERFYTDSSFDYISVLENLEKKNILKSDGTNFTLVSEICSLGNDYIENYSNRRLRRNTSYLIDQLIRTTNPEDYLFRAENAKYFNGNLARTYRFLNSLRNNDKNNSRLSEPQKQLLNIINTELKTDSKFSDEKNDSIITEKISCLIKINSPIFHLLEKAEFHYYYCVLLLNYSYRKRVQRFPKIKSELIILLDIYKKVKREQEIEVQVKIGLLLSTQLVNVLNDVFLKEAIQIYDDLQVILNEKKYQGNGFYDAYLIKLQLFSSCLLSPEESYEELENLLVKLKSKSSYYTVNEDELITLTLTNLLGISFYLTKENLNDVLDNFKQNKKNTDGFNKKRYKLENNIYLAEYILEKSTIEESITKLLSIDNDSHIVQMNLAGLYFYLGRFGDAKKILSNILEEEPDDDFYYYFCHYNNNLIQLFSQEIDNNEKIKYLDNLKSLKIPTLFQSKDIQKCFKEKNRLIIDSLNNSEKKCSIESLEKELSKFFGEQTPILQKIWQFSDYQYWS